MDNIPNFDTPSPKVQSPSALCHVVLRTGNLPAMKEFYLTFLGGRVAHRNEVLSFISYEYEHHCIALFSAGPTAPKVPASCGLEHIAFGFPTLSDLMLGYRQRKARGINPIWCVNHGPTTSVYYKDPEGNVLETQVDNFETPDQANEFMAGRNFAENPIGTDFDPEEMIRRLRAGEKEADLKRRTEIGPRAPPDLDSL